MLEAQLSDLAEVRRHLFQQFWERPEGMAWCERHTALVDRAVQTVFEAVRDDHPALDEVAIIATGGYGRRELSPLSDVDVTLVPSEEPSEDVDAGVRALFQRLHWAFGTVLRMEVGYAYRLVSDLPGVDASTRTGLLDARLVAGQPERFGRLTRELQRHLVPGEFVLSKIREREAAFAKFHDSPLVAEPQLKEGAGGMRCFHCANWIRQAIGEIPHLPNQDLDQVVLARNGLHLVAGRFQDLLNRSRRSELTERLGVDSDTWMSDLTAAMERVHQEFHSARQRLSEGRFALSGEVMAITGEARVLPNAEAGTASVGVSVATQLGLRVSELQPQRKPVSNGPAALYAVAAGEETLRSLDRSGLLVELLPELTACRTLQSRDSTHVYTVFEHTLRVVRNVERLEPGSFLGNLRDQLVDLEALMLAVLLHDVGKIDPDREHSEVGAELARQVGARWKLGPSVIDTVEWLVREHLTMARYIRIRDIESPETVTEFARIVETPERLAMLTLLTWADVNAVNSGAWTASQAAFLERLYRSTSQMLEGEGEASLDPKLYRQRLLRQLSKEAVDETRLQAFLESLPAYYVTTTPPDVAQLHLRLADRALQGEPGFEIAHQPELSATEITVCGLDQPGLLSSLLGVFYAFDLSLLRIRACTTRSVPAVALDSFTLSFGGRVVPSATLRLVGEHVLKVLKGEADVDALLREKGKDPDRGQEVFSFQYLEGHPGILEVRAPRGRGMAYRLSRQIARHGWNVTSARIGQWAGNAAAAFYLTAGNGSRLEGADVMKAMRG